MAAQSSPSPDKLWRAAVLRAVKRLSDDGKVIHLEHLADALVTKAKAGDVQALREIGDRLDGKPAQSVSVEATGNITHTHGFNEEALSALSREDLEAFSAVAGRLLSAPAKGEKAN